MKLPSSKTKKFNAAKKNIRMAIVFSTFNQIIGDKLLKNTLDRLKKLKVSSEKIKVVKVPGALEIPFAVNQLLLRGRYDAIITLGIVIKGETPHFDLVAGQSYQAIMQLNLKFNTPIIFGILTANNVQQAVERAEKNKMNKGAEFAESAVYMTNLIKSFNKR